MHYCTDHRQWVDVNGKWIDAEGKAPCAVWAAQAMKDSKIKGCVGCRLLKYVKGGKK